MHAMGFKLKLAIAAHISITPEIVRQAFVNTELWPMDFRFLQWRENDHIVKEEECSKLAERISSGGPCAALKSVRSRRNDSEAWAKLSDVFRTRNDTATAISELKNP